MPDAPTSITSTADEIDIAVPLRKEYTSTLRVIVASLGADNGLSVDEIDDLKLAVSEVFTLLIESAGPKPSKAQITYSTEAGTITIALDSDHDGSDIELDSLASTILTSVVDEHDVRPRGVTLVKRGTETFRADVADTDTDIDDLDLFREFVQSRRRSTRNQLVERHMGLASHIAQRFGRAGRHDDDLRQVAMIGLVKAVDRFDPEYGVKFSSFAGQTIEGELKRHFRDASWAVKVPRRAKELHLLVRNAIRGLEASGRPSPTVDDLALHLHLDRDEVLRGLSASTAATVGTIDAGVGNDDGATDRQSALADDDRAFDDAENAHVVSELLDGLPERERRIVELRFYDDMSQSEIAETIGVSQMHVSRLLKRTFETMRTNLLAGSADENAAGSARAGDARV